MVHSPYPTAEAEPAQSPGFSEQAEAKAVSHRRRVRVMIALLVLIVLIGVNLAIGSGVLEFDKVVSESMEPTLMIGDILLSDANVPVARYDVVVVINPEDPLNENDKYVKRVLGMPGDVMLVDAGVLYVRRVGESRLREEYSAHLQTNVLEWPRYYQMRVPEGKYFLVGDNRNNSYDSFEFGPVDESLIKGVVQRIAWPPERWGPPQPLHEDSE